MKIISLNTWGGRAGKDNLLDFFRRHKGIDVFCLQEIWEGGEEEAPKWGEGIDTAMISNIGAILENHSVFFRSHYRDYYGLAMFVKKDLKVTEEGDIFVFKERENIYDDFTKNHARNLQYLSLETEYGLRTIMNFHGIWNGMGKTDTPERLEQADKINNFIQTIPNPHVLVGDFNLLPESESLKRIEKMGLRNLIKEAGVSSTRSSHYKKPDKFADYALVSKDIKVNDFKVLPDEISDHLAMYLDFE